MEFADFTQEFESTSFVHAHAISLDLIKPLQKRTVLDDKVLFASIKLRFELIELLLEPIERLCRFEIQLLVLLILPLVEITLLRKLSFFVLKQACDFLFCALFAPSKLCGLSFCILLLVSELLLLPFAQFSHTVRLSLAPFFCSLFRHQN